MSQTPHERSAKLSALERLAPLLIAGAALLVYLNSLGAPFIFDDLPSIRGNPSIRCLWPVTVPLNPPPRNAMQARPLLNLSFAVNYALGGLDEWGYHAGNLLLHVLTALLLYGVVRRTLATERLRATFGRSATGLALAVAMIWCVHPLTTASVSYVSSRTEVLMGFWFLLTIYCAVRGADSPQRAGWTVATIVACALGMASKEVMISAPFVVLLHDYLFCAGSFRETFQRRRGLYVGLAATWLVLVVASAGTTFSVRRGGGPPFTMWEYVITQSEVIVHYLRLSFWPAPLVLDYYDWPVSHLSLALVVSLVIVLGLLGATIWALVTRKPAGLAGAVFFLVLGPTSSFLPILGEVAAERRMYLPLTVVVTMVVLAVWKVLANRWVPVLGAMLAVAIFGVVTVRRNEDYRSALAIWSDTAAKRPNNARALTEVGTALVGEGRIAEASEYYEKATQAQPDYVMAYSNWGVALGMQGKLSEAVGKLVEAVQRSPTSASAHYNLGLALAKQGRTELAACEYRIALEINPTFTKARDSLARIPVLPGATQTPEAVRHAPAKVD